MGSKGLPQGPWEAVTRGDRWKLRRYGGKKVLSEEKNIYAKQ